MESGFSPKTKELISEARLIAIELGYDYVSTLHLFLADCKIIPFRLLIYTYV
jgi:hypothetical protein